MADLGNFVGSTTKNSVKRLLDMSRICRDLFKPNENLRESIGSGALREPLENKLCPLKFPIVSETYENL